MRSRTQTPSPISLSRALELAASFVPLFSDELEAAIAQTDNLLLRDPEAAAALDPGQRTGIVNAVWMRRVRAALQADPRVAVYARAPRMFGLIIDRRVLVRFKKLDSNLCAGNYYTDAQDADRFHGELHGFHRFRIVRLVYGYTTSAITGRVAGQYLTCPNGWAENHWAMRVDATAADTMPLLAQAGVVDPDSTDIIVRPRRARPSGGVASA